MGAGIEYVISVGSNLPSGNDIVSKGLSYLESVMTESKRSEIYMTPSISKGDNSTYFNAVISGHALFSPDEMLKLCKDWEVSVGRKHIPGEHIVAGDMDIVMIDGTIARPVDYERDYFIIGFNQICKEGTISPLAD